jgi:hypothetical protein
VGVGVLADLTVRLPSPVTGRPPRRRRLRKAPTFALEGPPLTTARLRADLAAAGLREHRPTRPWFGRRPETTPEVVLVVVGSLVDGLNEAWSRRVQRGAMQSWRGFLASWDARADLPPAASPLVAVDRWADRVGAANVHVVTTDLLARQVAEVLGRGPGAGTPQGRAGDGEPVPLRPALADVLRRVNAVLPFLLPGEQAPARRTALARLMQQEQVGPRRLTMPEARRRWAARAAAAVAEELHGRGCTVHGDLGVLGRDVEGPDRRLRAGELATATVRMIHRVEERLDAASDRTQGVRR